MTAPAAAVSAKPRMLDLFSGAGGAARGYQLAGFYVVGVDVKPQPRYIGDEFHQADALEYLAAHGHEFDAIHASPPCQRYSKAVKKLNRSNHVDLVDATREALIETGKTYVLENVPTAPLVNAFTLCGSNFDLPIRRHRKFESNIFMLVPPCRHEDFPAIYPPARNRKNLLRVLSISGGYQTRTQLGEDFMKIHKAGMGIDWDISYAELSEAIPPAYTEYIGTQLMNALRAAAVSARNEE
jgi:DNA (cytosine-5)-methyltransferase 1